ncbi:MAG: M23 family metallopeptidase [Ruthenibacterium sp.]
MSRTLRVLLWLIMVLFFMCVLLGGTLYYAYSTTDATDFDTPAVSLCGEALTPSAVNWHAPVLGGVLYKEVSQAIAKISDVPVFETTEISLALPEGYTAHYQLTKDGAEIASGSRTDASSTIHLTANGTYHLALSLQKPQEEGKAYGTFTYADDFKVQVKPKIVFSSTKIDQGGVVAIEVSGVLDGSVATVETDLSLAKFTHVGDKQMAYLGVAYNREAGDYPIKVTCGDLSETQVITVVYNAFTRQDMTIDTSVSDDTMDNPNGGPEWRSVIWPLFLTADDTTYWSEKFIRPIEGAVNTEYGLFRYTNGSKQAERHAGVDLDGNEGDPVKAPNNGRVVYAGTLIFTGNTVVIEHGNGLKSYLFHMSRLDVKEGDMVTSGQIIGAVGSTGYSTGPHLHYEVRIGNQSINPMDLFSGQSGLYFKS